MEKRLEICYQHYPSLEAMATPLRSLVDEARVAAKRSYSPYSNFAVGAAARLASGTILCGANVESEVYPAGICAERNLLFHAATHYGDDAIVEFAISSISSDEECYPCGVCRQSLVDAERRQGSSIRVVMAGADSATVVDSASSLLPFTFKL